MANEWGISLEMSHRYLTDPSLSSINHSTHSSSTNPAVLLGEYGPRRPADPVEMRRLVLDYLCHQCFVDTASAFARESASNCNESASEAPAHTTSKAIPGDKSNQSTLAVKDTVVERTVRFDTDDDGDAEMGDLAETSTSHPPPHSNTAGVSGSSDGALLHPTHDTLFKDAMSVNTEDCSSNWPAGTDRAESSYPDWTAQDVQTTRIRLGEHILVESMKEQGRC